MESQVGRTPASARVPWTRRYLPDTTTLPSARTADPATDEKRLARRLCLCRVRIHILPISEDLYRRSTQGLRTSHLRKLAELVADHNGRIAYLDFAVPDFSIRIRLPHQFRCAKRLILKLGCGHFPGSAHGPASHQ